MNGNYEYRIITNGQWYQAQARSPGLLWFNVGPQCATLDKAETEKMRHILAQDGFPGPGWRVVEG